MATRQFRAGVLLVIRHPVDDLVMAFERVNQPGAWQFPQGGIDPGERPIDAAWRELREETSLTADDVELVGTHPDLIAYEYPPGIFKSDYLGQVHRWFYFNARSADIEPVPDGDEFQAWTWMAPTEIAERAVEFRRRSYVVGLGL